MHGNMPRFFNLDHCISARHLQSNATALNFKTYNDILQFYGKTVLALID